MDMNAAEADDGRLARLAAGGDRAAFAALVERHYDFIYRVAYRWIGRREDAEDVAQDVCARLGQAMRGWRGESRLTTWLYQLTLNAVRDRQRAAEREMRKARGWFMQSLVEPAHAVADDDRDDGDGLWAAVRRLPEKTRDAVLLVYAEEKSHAEAAAILGCSESTVSWHVHDARKRLKRLLREAGEEV